MVFELPKLEYEFNALEPFIDAQTVEIHYTKHHQGYVNNLNNALSQENAFQGSNVFENCTPSTLLRLFDKLPEQIKTVVKNNAGGIDNHNLYWEAMNKNGKKVPSLDLALALQKTFGGIERTKELLTNAGIYHFGSGWAWLVLTKRNPATIEIYTTPNQDSPLIFKHEPLLGIDLWEHAYYLKYQNKRAHYIEAFWNLVDWGVVEGRYMKYTRLRDSNEQDA